MASKFNKRNALSKVTRGVKRKINERPNGKSVTMTKSKRKQDSSLLNEEIESSESDYSEEEEQDGEISGHKYAEVVRKGKQDSSSSDNDEETPQEKKLRLAKLYLAEIEREEQLRTESKEVNRAAIAHRLQEDALEEAGRLQRKVADSYGPVKQEAIRILKGHKLPPTCLVISTDDKYLFSASKDGALIKWCFNTGKRLKVIPLLRSSNANQKRSEIQHLKGHTKKILCLAVSSDSKYLASGSEDKIINIWDPETMEVIHTFRGHRGTVTGLVFRKGTHDLYSASEDRSVKVWNLTEMTYVETMFGHQDAISTIDALGRERAITAGGRDNTIRIWKIVEESQLVFMGHKGSIDCVRLINEEHFMTCSDDGSIGIWGVLKKRPLVLLPNAHGLDSSNDVPNWITSIAALRNTDLVASGSNNGNIILWKCSNKFRTLSVHQSIKINGFINALQFSNNGCFLVAAVGQEHRMGRWFKMKEAKNSICIISLNRQDK